MRNRFKKFKPENPVVAAAAGDSSPLLAFIYNTFGKILQIILHIWFAYKIFHRNCQYLSRDILPGARICVSVCACVCLGVLELVCMSRNCTRDSQIAFIDCRQRRSVWGEWRLWCPCVCVCVSVGEGVVRVSVWVWARSTLTAAGNIP